MKKLQMTKHLNFDLSRKLVGKLSCNQLLLLLPAIVDKLIYELCNPLKHNKTESIDWYSLISDDKDKSNKELSIKDPFQDSVQSKCISCAILSEEIIRDHIDQCLIVILSRMVLKTMILFKEYKWTKRHRRSSSKKCDSATNSSANILIKNNGDVVNYSKLSNSKSVHTDQRRKMTDHEDRTIRKIEEYTSDDTKSQLWSSKFISTSEIDQLCIVNEVINDVEDDNSINYVFLNKSIHKFNKPYFYAASEIIDTNISKELKWSEYYSTLKLQGVFPQIDLYNPKHYIEVQIGLADDSQSFTDDNFNNKSMVVDTDLRYDRMNANNSVASNRSAISLFPLNTVSDINQRVDAQPNEHLTDLILNDEKMKIVRLRTSPTKSDSIIPTELEKKDKGNKKSLSKNINNKENIFCHKATKFNTSYKKEHNHTTRCPKPLLSQRKVFRLGISRIINGRFLQGWYCTYKECLSFNALYRPTCYNCFNARSCHPYLSSRDVMCCNCGYINYKSRLYCKKCKYIFVSIQVMETKL